MNIRCISLVIVLILVADCGFLLFSCQKPDPVSSTIALSSEEQKLYDLIMRYREEKQLPVIPLSESLTFVAQTHVKDLADNFDMGKTCNMHSWSDKGNWTACCYTSDHAKAECMWNKPREMTSYKGYGYEISHGGSKNYLATAESAFNGWKNSSGHNAVMINEGVWKDKWNAIGIGIYKGYACVWFGKESDEQ